MNTSASFINKSMPGSGEAAFFAVLIENKGKKGPWGPMVSGLIP
jgi:hypothetical protein